MLLPRTLNGLIILLIFETPAPGIEPGNPEGNEFSRLTQYHCAMRAYLYISKINYKPNDYPLLRIKPIRFI